MTHKYVKLKQSILRMLSFLKILNNGTLFFVRRKHFYLVCHLNFSNSKKDALGKEKKKRKEKKKKDAKWKDNGIDLMDGPFEKLESQEP